MGAIYKLAAPPSVAARSDAPVIVALLVLAALVIWLINRLRPQL